MHRAVPLVAALHLSACGWLIGLPDLSLRDAMPPDSGSGSVADAAPVAITHIGQALFLDLAFQDFPELGSGPFIDVLFQRKAEIPAPSYEEYPGSRFGCKVAELTPEDFAPAGIDEGVFRYTVAGGPELPPCTYALGEGYRCIGVIGAGGDIGDFNSASSLFSLTSPKVRSWADEVGRMLVVNGAINPSNNGQFPIVASIGGDRTVVFRNQTPGASTEAGTTAQYLTLAGLGPAGRSKILADDAQVSFALTVGDDAEVEDFSHAIDIGDSFTIDDASANLITNVPTDGSSFAIGCTGEGGTCGTATDSLLQIIATDGDTSQVPPFGLPPPQRKAITVFCILQAGRLTVSEAASQYIADVNPTRIRAIFARANNELFTEGTLEMQIAAGHALGGITHR